MGFKDLVKFNEAMLAKQVWRLLTDKTSLLYKVFSAKYFPSSSIFDAKLTKGSYAWQSNLKARKAGEKGMIWRTGDGKKPGLFMITGFLEFSQ